LIERLQKSPDDPKLNYDLGLAYFQQKRLGEARPFLEKAAALTPESHDVWMALSLVLLGLKDYHGAANPLRHLRAGEGRERCVLSSGPDAVSVGALSRGRGAPGNGATGITSSGPV
jgi:uncharacterized protein HemY